MKNKTLNMSRRHISDVKIGDIVGNKHNQFGRVLELDDRRARVHLQYLDKEYGYYETSITGDTAIDTLDICGYKIFDEV